MKFPVKLKIVYVAVGMFIACTAFAHNESAKMSPLDAGANDSFGISVAIDASLAVVGAYKNDTIATDCGAAYV